MVRDTLPGFLDLGLPLKSKWKPPWSHSSCILHSCKASTAWVIPKSASSLAPLNHSCRDLWIPGFTKMNPREWILQVVLLQKASWGSLSKAKSFKELFLHPFAHPLSQRKIVPCLLLRYFQDTFPIVLMQITWLLYNTNVNNHDPLWPSFAGAAFLTKH